MVLSYGPSQNASSLELLHGTSINGDSPPHPPKYEGLSAVCPEDEEAENQRDRNKSVMYAPLPSGQFDAGYWIESPFFSTFTTFVIFANVVLVIDERNDWYPREVLMKYELALLFLYVLEVICNVGHFRCRFFFGHPRKVFWNWFDTVVIAGGLGVQACISLGVLPPQMCPVEPTALRALCFSRWLRVLQLLGHLWETRNEWSLSGEFETFIALIIAFNAVIMGFETDLPWHGWHWIEQVLLLIFFI